MISPPSVVNAPPSPVQITAKTPESSSRESDFVVILAALLCALISVVGLLAVARCAWLRRSGEGFAGGILRQPWASKGLKKKVLQSFPKVTYDSSSMAKADCAICLADYADGDEIRVLPQCGHGFHVVCIDTWLGSHLSCPSCRQVLAVASCHKCGEVPEISGATRPAETELKYRQDCFASSSADFLP